MGDSGSRCLKCLLFVFNVLYLILGIVIIVVGSLIAHVVIDANISTTQLLVACSLFIGIGVLAFLTGIFGCCGAIRESRCCLAMFAIGTLVLILLAVAVGVLGLGYGDKVAEYATDAAATIQNSIKDYNPDEKTTTTSTWDKMQYELECCGMNSPTDWQNASHLSKDSVPDSCCRINSVGCGEDAIRGKTVDEDDYYNIGCREAIKDFVGSCMHLVGGICIAVAVIEILGTIFACCLMCTIRESYSV